MNNEEMLKDSIRELIYNVIKEEQGKQEQIKINAGVDEIKTCDNSTDDGFVEDVTVISMQDTFCVPNAHDPEGYMKMKQSSSGRLGIWRAGPRPLSKAYVRFIADHAAAQGAVWSEVDQDIIKELGFICLESISSSKAEYLKNPNTGKRLSPESVEIVKQNANKNVNVQIVFADGLSSSAIEKNAKDVLPALQQGLKSLGLTYATPFFVTNGRVAVSEEIGELSDADVVVMLCGERPGLNSQSSLGAYVAYKPTIGMEESRRTVISNIHRSGTVPVEAGAQIAELCQSMIKHKISGVELKLI
ncbi:ethanolamine ammonia-lyase subunit EutC [Alkalibaculum sp. M08DMB]|uniref:Ethanolamine ammonia-lyase small subunit n=1 Tax=Alkalibaculum sporogenes TaxID=2655001 RepID=A0A6A7K805_9FIRM|nr:ethanolamine ammonia-lyase subunit EutC [Alkalibaculum sporogenes]MPW25525.1 ethanolamine ammonia-lyase subunit EutC [Alkalibaculum sporogenes]